MANQLALDIEEGEILEQDLDLVTNMENRNVEYKNPVHYIQNVAPGAKKELKTLIGRPISSMVGQAAKQAVDVRGYFTGRREQMNKTRELMPCREASIAQQKDYSFDFFTLEATNNSTYSRAYYKSNGKKMQKEVYPVTAHGVAENIMSQIDEVMCKQSRTSTRRRKRKRTERVPKYKFPHYDRRSSSYGLSFGEIVFNKKSEGGGGVSRKRCERCRHCSHDSSPEKSLSEESSRLRLSGRRKRRKLRREGYEGDELEVESDKSGKLKSLRDFDEVRRDLLEKLRRKEEEAMQKSGQYEEVVSSSTMHVPATACKPTSDAIALESEGEEELDVTRLRLIALASNNSSKSGRKGNVFKSDHSNAVTKDADVDLSRCEEKRSEEADFDRNELLLRAEALKTALLKKHQKRQNNLKKGNGGPMADITVRNAVSPAPTSRSGELKQTKLIEDELPKTGGEIKETASHVSGSDNDGNDVNDEDDDGCKENVGSYCSEETTTPHSKSKRFTDHVGRARKKRIRSSAVTQNKTEESREEMGRSPPPCGPKMNRNDGEPTKSSGTNTNFLNTKVQKSVEDSSTLLKGTNDLVAAHSKSSSPSAGNKTEKENNVAPPKSMASAVVPKPDIQRIIVHLGSEDSSDDEEAPVAVTDDDSTSAREERQPSFVSFGDSDPMSMAPSTKDTLKVRDEKIMSLLGRTRLEIDKELQRASKMKPAASAEAICKHLPPSQRLEYLRLKQKIAEREYLKKKSKKLPGASSVSGEKPMCIGVGRGGESRSRIEIPATQGPRVLRPPESAPSAPPARLLPDRTLIAKLRFLLKKMKIEKTIEENYKKEIGRLKSQLTVLEKRKVEQELKIRKLAEESLKTYKIIRGEGPPADGVLRRLDVASSQITAGGNPEVASAEKQEEEPCPGASRGGAIVAEHPVAKKKSVGQPVPYNSPLEAFSRGSAPAARLDPNAIMCQFDFTGVCRDEECAYQHVRTT